MSVPSISAERVAGDELLLRSFIEQTPACIAMLDRDMRYLAVSARYREEFYRARDVVGKSFYELLPETPEFWRDLHRRALAGETLCMERDPFARGDGAAQSIRWEIRPWVYPDESVGGVMIYAEDMTGIMARAEQEPPEAEIRLKAALCATPDATCIADPNGNIVEINQAFANFYKFGSIAECRESLGELATLIGVFAPDGSVVRTDQWPTARALRGETATGIELKLRRLHTGEEWLGSYSFAPVRDGDGAIVGSVATARDITAARRTELALRDERRRLEATVGAALEAIVAIDRHGVIRSANPAACQMFGYAAEEMVGHNVVMLMPEAERSEHDSHIAAYLGTGVGKIIDTPRRLLGRRKNGEIFPTELTITEARVDDDALFIGFMRDLTTIEAERHRVNELRDELARVSRLNDMGAVVSALTHEVAQPLMSLTALAETAMRLCPEDATTQLKAILAIFQKQSDQAAAILKRLRRFIEKRDARLGPENLNDLLDDALTLAMLHVNGRPFKPTLEQTGDDVDVNVDAIQVQQVLVNFLRNAADAVNGAANPQIRLAATLDRPGFVRVSVSDNGSGVDPEVADRLFTPFVTTKPSGMGVGLSLCKSLVESNGGEIGFGANVPHGAVFWFTLPVFRDDGENPVRGRRKRRRPASHPDRE